MGAPRQDSEVRIWESRRGQVVGTDGEGRPVVDFLGNPHGPRVARRAVPLEGSALELAVSSRQQVTLRFEEGDPKRPLIVALGWECKPNKKTRYLLLDKAAPTGERIRVIQARNELTVVYGDANIIIRGSGTVVIRGDHVRTDEHFLRPEASAQENN